MSSTPPLPPVRVFYSYSHQDEELRKELEKHLKPLVRLGLLEDWRDRQIEAGAEWDAVIRQKLGEAEVILLLISPDFMSSDYIWDKELAPALARHRAGTARVIPIFARPTVVKGMEFTKLQGLPRDAKPVVTWSNRDDAWVNVVQGIRTVAEVLQQQKLRG
jgi:hypothetical protein